MAKKKLKIVFLSFYSGAVYRGVETYVHELANRLVDLGHDVMVYQVGHNLDNSRYKVVTINVAMNWKLQGSGRFFVASYNVFKVAVFTIKCLFVLNRNTDILISTNGRSQSILSKIWSLSKKTKYIVSGQAGPGMDERINLLSFPDVFVGLTDSQIQWARKVNPFNKYKKIPNGVDLNKFKIHKNAINIDLPRPIILCVAAFDQFKRIDLIIKAVSKLDKGSLLLVGRGIEEKKLKQLAEKLIKGRYRMENYKHSEMPDVYSSADLFTFSTSPSESFGIVLVEAMASGLPVVAADDPIRREIVGDAGLYVDPTDAAKYAETLQRALEIDWGDKPRKQASKFDWDNIAKDYEELFFDLTK